MARSTIAAALAGMALALAACGGAETGDAPSRAAASEPAENAPRPRSRAAVEDCSTRSEASFPGAFSNPDNVVVGPLVIVGAAVTAAITVREYGGDKLPVLVRAGHRVTLALSRRTRRVAGLGYGRLPEGVELEPRDGHRVVEFIACEPGGPSQSTAAGQRVTFWSGFVLTRTLGCVPIDVRVDDERSPRRVVLAMGVPRCELTRAARAR
jgi:hypothetical protein